MNPEVTLPTGSTTASPTGTPTRGSFSDVLQHRQAPVSTAAATLSTTAAESQLIAVSGAHYDKLTTTTFPTWSFTWKSALSGVGLSRYLAEPLPEGASNFLRRQDALIHSAMASSITSEVLQFLLGCDTTYKLWTTLHNMYGKQSRATLMATRDSLSHLQKGDLPMHQYLMEIRRLIYKLSTGGIVITDDEMLFHVHHGLPSDYDNIMGGFRTRSTDVSFDEVYETLIDAERSLAHRASQQQQAQSLMIHSIQSGRGSARGGQSRSLTGAGSGSSQAASGSGQWQGGGKKGGSKYKPTCQLCGTKGHVLKGCTQWKGLMQVLQGLHVSGGSATADGASNPRVHYTSQSSPGTSNWLVDSGASHHVSQDLQNFSQHTPYDGTEEVHLGDGQSHPIRNTGFTILPSASKSLRLNDVLHVPNLNKSLISVQKLCSDNDVSIHFRSTSFCVKDNRTGAPLVQGAAKGGVYHWPSSTGASLVSSSTSSPTALSASIKPVDWHCRLGHPSSLVLRQILKSLGVNVSLKKSFSCNSCQCAKMHKLPFATSTIHSTKVLEFIYSDVWGPSPVSSADGYSYYVLFVDHFTRYMWFFPIKNKSDVSTIFPIFKKVVENLFDSRIKNFYSDNGGEFIKLKSFFHDHGINHLLTPPYTPEHNAISERRHRHVVETGLALLHTASLPLKFWSYAFRTAVYLINRMPTKVLDDVSPFLKLFHEHPNYSKLRTFGCLCYPLLRPYTSHKLEYRSSPCVFLGYAPQQSAYFCFDVQQSKVFTTRHVHFVEHQFPFASSVSQKEHVTSETVANWAPSFSVVPYSFSSLPNVVPTASFPAMSSDLPSPVSSPVPVSSSSPSTPAAQHVVSNPCPGNDDQMATSSPSSAAASSVPALGSSGPAHDKSTSSSSSSRDDQVSSSSSLVSSAALPASVSTHPMVTRSKNNITKPVKRLCLSTVLRSIPTEPRGHKQAFQSSAWTHAMTEEIAALHRNKTWSLVPPKPHIKPVGSRWVYRVKLNSDGTVARYKARLVAKGYLQRPGMDFYETFSPVAKHITLRIILALAVSLGWILRQIDVNNAFLHGRLHEEVYMEQPPGFVDPSKPDWVCLLHQAIYGLKQAPRAWYDELRDFLFTLGFWRSQCDHCLFVFKGNEITLFLVIYVDDLIITGSHPVYVQQFIMKLAQRFSIKDLGFLNYFLGVEVLRGSDGIILSQRKYILELLDRTKMLEAKPVSTPMPIGQAPGKLDGVALDDSTEYRSIVGGLQYLQMTRPDIAYTVNKLAQFSSAPTDTHWQLVKRLLRYLAGTADLGLLIRRDSQLALHAFSDSDWAGNKDDRTSTSAYIIFLGSTPISWMSKKQKAVARSSTEAEYRAIATAVSEVRWIQHLLQELRVQLPSQPVVYCDNLGATFTCKNPVFHSRVRHIEIDFHFVRDLVAKGLLRVSHVPTKEQLADILTKALPKALHQALRHKIGICDRNAILRGRIKDNDS